MKKEISNLLDYEKWANEEIVKSLVSIPNPPESALSLMSHIANAQILWLARMDNKTSDVPVWKVYDKDELLKTVVTSSDELIMFVRKLQEEDFSKTVNYTNSKKQNFISSFEDILHRLIIHSSYHRGQTILTIKPVVSKLPYTDYIHFVRTIKK